MIKTEPSRERHSRLDVCIVGAGPAGLNAALILGRCGRQVAVFDSGQPRNAMSAGLHGYLTRDGVSPRQLRELGRAELAAYPSVSVHDQAVTAVRRADGGFLLTVADGSSREARILLLATGRVDLLPEKPGFREWYGRGVFHCPICDGWENRGQIFVTYGRAEPAAELALDLLTWSPDVTLCTDGPAEFGREMRERLARHKVSLIETEVVGLRGDASGRLAQIALADGGRRPCGALFFDAATPQRSSFAENLGAEVDASGGICCNEHAATSVPGLFVAGNVRCGIHLAITAAAEGAEAAIAIHEALLEQDLR